MTSDQVSKAAAGAVLDAPKAVTGIAAARPGKLIRVKGAAAAAKNRAGVHVMQHYNKYAFALDDPLNLNPLVQKGAGTELVRAAAIPNRQQGARVPPKRKKRPPPRLMAVTWAQQQGLVAKAGPWPDKKLARHQRAQAELVTGASLLGLSTLAAKGGKGLLTRIKPAGRTAKVAEHLDAGIGHALVAGAGVGGVSGLHSAAIQRQEAQRTKATKVNKNMTISPFGVDHEIEKAISVQRVAGEVRAATHVATPGGVPRGWKVSAHSDPFAGAASSAAGYKPKHVPHGFIHQVKRVAGSSTGKLVGVGVGGTAVGAGGAAVVRRNRGSDLGKALNAQAIRNVKPAVANVGRSAARGFGSAGAKEAIRPRAMSVGMAQTTNPVQRAGFNAGAGARNFGAGFTRKPPTSDALAAGRNINGTNTSGPKAFTAGNLTRRYGVPAAVTAGGAYTGASLANRKNRNQFGKGLFPKKKAAGYTLEGLARANAARGIKPVEWKKPGGAKLTSGPGSMRSQMDPSTYHRHSASTRQVGKAYTPGKITYHHEQAALHSRKKTSGKRQIGAGVAVAGAGAGAYAARHQIAPHVARVLPFKATVSDGRRAGPVSPSFKAAFNLPRAEKYVHRGALGTIAAGGGLLALGAGRAAYHGQRQNAHTRRAQAARQQRNSSIGKSAFGVEDPRLVKADSSNREYPRATAGRLATGTAFGWGHSAVAGKKGRKLGAVGSSLGHSVSGSAAGGIAGAGVGQLVGGARGRRLGVVAGGSLGYYAGNHVAVRANQRKGRLKAQVGKSYGYDSETQRHTRAGMTAGALGTGAAGLAAGAAHQARTAVKHSGTARTALRRASNAKKSTDIETVRGNAKAAGKLIGRVQVHGTRAAALAGGAAALGAGAGAVLHHERNRGRSYNGWYE